MSSFRPCGPTAKSIIAEKRNRRIGWTKALGELIDNSVGNGATNVSVLFKPHWMKCIDDGVGCDERKFPALVSLGMHVEDDLVENTVSRYGFGAKDAFIWANGPTQVYSSRNGEYRFIEVDWDSFGSDWEYDSITEGDKAKTLCEAVGLNGSGVCIVLPHHNRAIRNAKDFLAIHADLSRLFWAAVETGVQITVQYQPDKKSRKIGGLLHGKEMPNLIPEQSLETTMQLADGRTIRLIGGVLDPSARISHPGFEYIYGHRVVMPACGNGAGTLSFERVYFRVFLLGNKDDWQVETNKCGLHDSDEAALGQAVFDVCKPLLEYSQSESMAALADEDLLKEVSELVTQGNRKHAKRNRREDGNHGTVVGTGRGVPKKNTTQWHEKDGKYETTSGKASDKIDIKKSEFEDEDSHLIGSASVKDKIVRMNYRHPFVKRCIDERDKVCLFVAAMSIWSDEYVRVDKSGQGRISFKGNFLDKVSAMLKVNTAEEESAEATP